MDKETFDKTIDRFLKDDPGYVGLIHPSYWSYRSNGRKVGPNKWVKEPKFFLEADSGKYKGSVFEISIINMKDGIICGKISFPGSNKKISRKGHYSKWNVTTATTVIIESGESVENAKDFFDDEIKVGDWVYGPKYDRMIFGCVDQILAIKRKRKYGKRECNSYEIYVKIKKERAHFGGRLAVAEVDFGNLKIKDEIYACNPRFFIKIDSKEAFTQLLRS